MRLAGFTTQPENSLKFSASDADVTHVKKRSADSGFTLVEMLIVIVLMGLLSTVVIAAIRQITDRGQDSACGADARTLVVAAEAYIAMEEVTEIPETGVDDDRYERTLTTAGLLREMSTVHNLDQDGQLVQVVNSPCTV